MKQLQYRKFEVDKKALTVAKAFLDSHPQWRRLTPKEFKEQGFDEYNDNLSDFVVSPRGKIWQFHEAVICGSFYIKSVTLKSMDGLNI